MSYARNKRRKSQVMNKVNDGNPGQAQIKIDDINSLPLMECKACEFTQFDQRI